MLLANIALPTAANPPSPEQEQPAQEGPSLVRSASAGAHSALEKMHADSGEAQIK